MFKKILIFTISVVILLVLFFGYNYFIKKSVKELPGNTTNINFKGPSGPPSIKGPSGPPPTNY